MGAPQFWNDKPLFVDGKPAMDPACCCDASEICPDPVCGCIFPGSSDSEMFTGHENGDTPCPEELNSDPDDRGYHGRGSDGVGAAIENFYWQNWDEYGDANQINESFRPDCSSHWAIDWELGSGAKKSAAITIESCEWVFYFKLSSGDDCVTNRQVLGTVTGCDSFSTTIGGDTVSFDIANGRSE